MKSKRFSVFLLSSLMMAAVATAAYAIPDAPMRNGTYTLKKSWVQYYCARSYAVPGTFYDRGGKFGCRGLRITRNGPKRSIRCTAARRINNCVMRYDRILRDRAKKQLPYMQKY